MKDGKRGTATGSVMSAQAARLSVSLGRVRNRELLRKHGEVSKTAYSGTANIVPGL